MAGAFHGVSEADAIINVGVSGPGVVKHALSQIRGASFEVLCETIKKTAFKITRVGQLVAQEASRRLGVPSASSTCRWPRLRPWVTVWPKSGRNRLGMRRCSGNHGSIGFAERPGEEGRRDGFIIRGRAERSLYSGE